MAQTPTLVKSSKKEKERADGGRTRKPKTEHKENQNSLRIHHCGSLGRF
ncbi:uncharacterized protein G2W53_026611 [Senna tora]|uniref:Uncharacterized protein n=1 Tax=Senna tora TaxID=362788 RepID=A0A834THK0_9FABA|nr:uncharacterized protein G2W53_026611 [Senna tora]